MKQNENSKKKQITSRNGLEWENPALHLIDFNPNHPKKPAFPHFR